MHESDEVQSSAQERVQRIREEMRRRHAISSGKSMGGCVGPEKLSSSSSAQLYTKVLYGATEVLDAINKCPHTEEGMLTVLKLATSSGNMAILAALAKVPAGSVVATYPALGRLQVNASAMMGRRVANELLKLLPDFSASMQKKLTSVFSRSTEIIGVFDGKLPSTEVMVTWYSSYREITSLNGNFAAVGVSSVFQNLELYSSFCSFVVTIFLALGFVVQGILTISQQAQVLLERLSAQDGRQVMLGAVKECFESSFRIWASSVKTALIVLSLDPPPALIPIVRPLQEANQAIGQIFKSDLSSFGLGSAILCSPAQRERFLSLVQDDNRDEEIVSSPEKKMRSSEAQLDLHEKSYFESWEYPGASAPSPRKKEPFCIAFAQTGTCGFGGSCKFRHVSGAQLKEVPCRDFRLHGECPRGMDCLYDHGMATRGHEATLEDSLIAPEDDSPSLFKKAFCIAYAKSGSCPNGISCSFKHSTLEELRVTPCLDFKRGKCARGMHCVYSHDKPSF